MRIRGTARLLVPVLLAALLVPGLAGCGTARQSGSSGSYSGRAADKGGPAPLAAPGSGGNAASPAQEAAVPENAWVAAASEAKPAVERMVIRNANVRLEVGKVADAVTSLRALAKRYDGVVAQMQLSSESDGGAPQPIEGSERVVRSGLPFNASVTVLVPVAKFDEFRGQASKLGKTLSESSADDDVTQEHVDLKARLENAKAEEVRLRGFFDSAKNVTDMLAIEKELARVRGDIEGMTAQITTMERQAALATLTIELVEPRPIIRPESGIDWGFGEAITTGIQAMADVMKVALIFLLATAPLWLAAVVVVAIIRWRLRVKRARKADAAATETAGNEEA